ncbi:hypothetical protein D8674_025428 [Pyrus ussuriensis x Pyrus communis]|uniref:Uncharacterized protein n=1 Tax=Pyrus ussuriensis x Pyrus communis TaxID=2448454 RepID=A0A5N5H5L5_9ROSA|nr:hypothetical protein D8674_025428 [Pyrus ussuriensis x Pyrus communis]
MVLKSPFDRVFGGLQRRSVDEIGLPSEHSLDKFDEGLNHGERDDRKWLDEILSSDQQKPAAETTRNLNAFKKAANDSSSSRLTKLLVSKPESLPVVTLNNSKKHCATLADDRERVEIIGQDMNRAKKQKRLGTPLPVTCEISLDKSGGYFSCESPVTVLPPLPLCDHHEHGTTTSEAARVAMLKSRFAVTILKAQGPETPAVVIEKYRAAELAKANELIKKNRQRDREAARLALIEMEKNVDIDDPFKTMKEFEMIISNNTC